MRFLEAWFENPGGKLENLDAHIKLLSLANGEGGYLSEEEVEEYNKNFPELKKLRFPGQWD